MRQNKCVLPQLHVDKNIAQSTNYYWCKEIMYYIYSLLFSKLQKEII